MTNPSRRVPYFDYSGVYRRFESDFHRILTDVGNRGAFINQRDLDDFEASIAEYTGISHCLGVSNATDGLQLAFMAGGLHSGDEVIISTHTMVATASGIHFAGGVPVPVNVGPDHLIDLDSIRVAITKRTRAICPTHLNGRTCDMDAIVELAEEFGLDVYEDAAQGLGSKFRGRSAGSWGKASCLSFFPAKILGALGDGGAVLTNDASMAEELRLLRDHGRVDRGDTLLWGFNSRLDNLSAAFLLFQLGHFDKTVRHRRELAAVYSEELANIPGIALPPAPTDGDHFDTFQNFEIECDFRDDLQEGLRSRGVGTLKPWGGWAVHQFDKLGFTQSLPEADALFTRLLMLPLNMSVTAEDAEYVSTCILDIAGRRAA